MSEKEKLIALLKALNDVTKAAYEVDCDSGGLTVIADRLSDETEDYSSLEEYFEDLFSNVIYEAENRISELKW